MLISTTMENIGVMMFQRIVPAAVVSNLIGSSTFILWGKLEHWVEDLRAELDSPLCIRMVSVARSQAAGPAGRPGAACLQGARRLGSIEHGE